MGPIVSEYSSRHRKMVSGIHGVAFDAKIVLSFQFNLSDPPDPDYDPVTIDLGDVYWARAHQIILE